VEKIKKGAGFQQMLLDKCSECEGIVIVHDYDSGEDICGNCGLVIQDVIINNGPEWRAFTIKEKEARSRVGMPTSYMLHDKGLSTTIKGINYDAYGNKLPLSTKLKMWRLRREQIRYRAYPSTERNLAQAMTVLKRLCDKASLPNHIKENAALIYRKALNKGLVRGRSITTIIAASLYAACRKTGTPRNLKEIAEVSLTSKKKLAKCYRLLLRNLDLHIPLSDPVNFLSKIAERSDISGHTQLLALEILKEAKKKHLQEGKNPRGVAGAALYIACILANEKRTQKDIAESAGITEVTIRNRYSTFKGHIKLELSD
jgi:transcription initiation factor TFIIB